MLKLLKIGILSFLTLILCLSNINAHVKKTKKSNPNKKTEKWQKLKSEKLIMSISIPANWVEESIGGAAGSSEEGGYFATSTYAWTSPPNKSGISLNKLEITTEDSKKISPNRRKK
jgi:hypothetical protein